MGLTEDELPEIVQRWRLANKRIVDLWFSLENAALEVMRTGQPVGIKGIMFSREGDYKNGLNFLTITLPNRRKLFYAQPFLEKNQFDKEALHYWGINQEAKKWGVTSTYGGKIVENCVQAIARDCLAESLLRLYTTGYETVMHIHDEVVLDAPGDAESELVNAIKIMEQPIPWAPGLLLKADGFVTDYYRKE